MEYNEEEEELQDEQQSVEIARGGPVYAPNFVGPLTSVSQFRSDVLLQLQSLEAQLCFDSPHSSDIDQDVSVDDLKIIADVDLVHMALKEALKDGDEENLQPSLQLSEDKSRKFRKQLLSKHCLIQIGLVREAQKEEKGQATILMNLLPSYMCTSLSKPKPFMFTLLIMSSPVKGDYMGKVKELAEIKQKQDDDKAAAKLHSVSANCKTSKGDPPSCEANQWMKSLRFTNSTSKPVKSLPMQEHRTVSYPEVVLCVELYHTKRKWVKTQELVVLGCQTLAELRDKIYCLKDQVMHKAGQHDPSGYFLIENAFYNDFRDPSAIDYSEPIRYWLRNCKDEALKKWEWINMGKLQRKQEAVVGDVGSSDLPRFKTLEMHRTKFSDLSFRLGAGYLYCHQGACEHVIVIRDMRMIHPGDSQNREAYPILTFQLKVVIRKCNVCKIYRAKKVTVDDKWSPENPCYLCDYCYSLLHSDDGQPYIEYVHD
ncbi:snRNA-activating protein complex subunit-like [Rutidosis leptorrhynchoides]|uniref:snRNA-activating protein complex subunit-like n=1 Tax=Rutidosis leptorrhynchoides TaxID=125765 RepID=UPI003A98FCB4